MKINKILALCLSTVGFAATAHAETVTTEPIPGAVAITSPTYDTYYPDAPTTIDVTVYGYLETSQTILITLAVDDVLHSHSCDTSGDCVFTDITLEQGVHTLYAEGLFDGGFTDYSTLNVYVGEEPPEETTDTTSGETETTAGESETTGGETAGSSGESETTGGETAGSSGEVGTEGNEASTTDSGDEKGGCTIASDHSRGLSLAFLLVAAGLMRRRSQPGERRARTV